MIPYLKFPLVATFMVQEPPSGKRHDILPTIHLLQCFVVFSIYISIVLLELYLLRYVFFRAVVKWIVLILVSSSLLAHRNTVGFFVLAYILFET